MNKITFDKTMEEVKHDLETRSDLSVIDVREVDEYKEGHIAGARNIPLSTLQEHIQELRGLKQDIYVYCHSGQRSASARKILIEGGVSSVYNVGGIIHWTYDIKEGEDA